MKSLCRITKFLIFLLSLYCAYSFFGKVVMSFMGRDIEVHAALIVCVVFFIYFICSYVFSLLNRLICKFSGKSNHEKGVICIESALSSIFIKDKISATLHVEKAKKYLGDMPIVSWLNGQIKLLNNEEHKAKAIFYSMSAKEDKTVFGAYSLCQLALKNGSAKEALSAIDAVLHISPKASELSMQAIAIFLQMKRFSEAKMYLKHIQKLPNAKTIEAAICVEEALSVRDDISLVKKAYALGPEIVENTLLYADLLIRNCDYKKARKILFESINYIEHIDLFEKYINAVPNSQCEEKIYFAKKLLATNSWIAHYKLGELMLEYGMHQAAFNEFYDAYLIKPYECIVQSLVNSAKTLDVADDPRVKNVLLDQLDVVIPYFVWKCSHCNCEHPKWSSVCSSCNKIGTMQYCELFNEKSNKPQITLQ